MPGITRRGRKRPSESLSDDEEQSDAPPIASFAKRARHSRDASERVHYAKDEGAQDVHQPGSLVRVRVTNFVTYTAAEFNLGPSLNMIIGPNGTGKSTLVCAICIGLGWPTKLLGRSKDIGEFVKHGYADAEIEIELAGAPNHRQNPVVRRQIRKEGNKSQFFINDRHTSQREVQELAASFSIQIDNLCQFLPQDRVVDFAKMTPVDKLTETQRAVAPPQMLAWHEELKDLRSQEKGLQTNQQNEESHLKSLQAKQSSTEEDVRKWQERQKLVIRAKTLEKCRPVIETHALKVEVEECKRTLQTTKEELTELNKELQPVRQAQQDMQVYRDQIECVARNRQERLETVKRSTANLAAGIETKQQAFAGFAAETEGEVNSEKQRKQDVKRIEGVIAGLNRTRQQRPVEYDRASFEERKRELRNRMNVADRGMMDAAGKLKEIRPQVEDLKNRMQRLQNERAQLDTQSGQRMNLLSKMSADTYTGWKWIEENRDQLSLTDEIYGPPILTCSVKEAQFADGVESQLRKSEWTTITCMNAEDAKTIQKKLLGEKKLHDITIRTSPQSLAFYRAPTTRDELKAYGFDCWMIDCLQGPEPVLAMLCDATKIHRAAFAAKGISEAQYTALQNSVISKWVSGKEVFQISRRREYGLSSTSVTQLKEAKVLKDQPADDEEKRKLDDAVKEIHRELAERKELHVSSSTEHSRLREEKAQAHAEKDQLQAEEDAIKKALADWRVLPQRIADKEEELAGIRDTMAQTTARIRIIKAKSEEEALRIAALTIEYAKSVTQLRTLHESYVEAEIWLVEANSEMKALQDKNAHVLQTVEEKKALQRELKARKDQLTRRHNALVKKTQDELNTLTEDERDVLIQFQGKTMEELDNEIEATKSRLELMAEGNPDALKAYQDRQQLIDKAEEKLAQIAETLASIQEQIIEIRGEWEPELDRLMARISDKFSFNFGLIGCAGEVGLYKDEDFEKWSVQIQVRFRENETLSVLDSQRQSGGERAVSTAFYLMALQDLARSPFRVVDEINQGMDQRNERKVYERIVDIACRERTSQYFLITPKLLPDLKYHPKMRVHCIASGEHMPDQHKKLDFQALAELALRVRNQGRVAA